MFSYVAIYTDQLCCNYPVNKFGINVQLDQWRNSRVYEFYTIIWNSTIIFLINQSKITKPRWRSYFFFCLGRFILSVYMQDIQSVGQYLTTYQLVVDGEFISCHLCPEVIPDWMVEWTLPDIILNLNNTK